MPISPTSSSSRSAPFTRFRFLVRPKFRCWVLVLYLSFFPCSSISICLNFLCCVYCDLEEWLWMLVYLCLFFYSLLKYSFYASFYVFIFFILEVFGFVPLLPPWYCEQCLLCSAIGLGKKIYLYQNSTKTPSQIHWGLDLVFLIIIF